MKKEVIFIVLGVMTLLLSPFVCEADVMVVRAVGVVNPVMAEFISAGIDEAGEHGSEAVVIELDTPGGLDASMRTIVQKIISSKVPVAAYVSPSGARAASAGVFIVLSAHVAAMAPGTNIGAAHPVGIGGEMDETVIKKAENDAAAYIRSLAEKRGRNAEWAEKSVRESVSITHKEAKRLNVIDMVSPDISTLLADIDGRTVETSLGRQAVSTKGAELQYKEAGLRYTILNFISDPNVAYILMLLGFYGLFFELTNPGSIFPGVFGAMSLILAFYSFQTLPVNYAGIVLIVLGIILFILEIKVTSFGLLTVGGIISMIIGSLMLFESPMPFFRLSLKIILPAVIITALFFTVTVGLVIRAYRRKPVTGREGLMGMHGQAKSDVHEKGQVFVHGEIWSATSDTFIKAGEKIVVEEVNGLKLKVRPLTGNH